MPGGTRRRVRASATESATRSTTPAAGPVTVSRPDPDAWAVAVTLVNQDGDGDRRRLVVLDGRTVLVRNRPA